MSEINEGALDVGALPPEMMSGLMTAMMGGLSPKEALTQALGSLPEEQADAVRSLLAEVAGSPRDVIDAEPAAQPQRPRRKAAPQARPQPRRRDPEPEEPEEAEEGEEDNTDMLNYIGKSLGVILGELPGVEIGITLVAGGRSVRVAAYYPETPTSPVEFIDRKKASVSRLGDVLQLVFGEAYTRQQDEYADLDEDDEDEYEDLDEDEDEDAVD